jgi:hypothetical protein
MLPRIRACPVTPAQVVQRRLAAGTAVSVACSNISFAPLDVRTHASSGQWGLGSLSASTLIDTVVAEKFREAELPS